GVPPPPTVISSTSTDCANVEPDIAAENAISGRRPRGPATAVEHFSAARTDTKSTRSRLIFLSPLIDQPPMNLYDRRAQAPPDPCFEWISPATRRPCGSP